jgi:hypothetical protein
MKKFALAVLVIFWFLCPVAKAWQRDLPLNIPVDSSEWQCTCTYLHPNFGVVVADVVPVWEGKEVVQATYDSVFVIKADNSEMVSLSIPVIRPNPSSSLGSAQCYPTKRELIAGIPAVGDVDNDGHAEIIIGITNQYEFFNNYYSYTTFDYYSTLVWWTWDNAATDPHLAFVRHQLDLHADDPDDQVYLGTPVICRTGMTGGEPTVVFYGISRWYYGNGISTPAWPYSTSHRMTAFDLRHPADPEYSMSAPLYWSDMNSEDQGWDNVGSAGPFSVQAVDLNADGFDETIIHNTKNIRVLTWNNGWVAFSGFNNGQDLNLTTLVGTNWEFSTGSFSIADVNGDGSLEIIAPVEYCEAYQARQFQLLQINLDGTGLTYDDPAETRCTRTVPAVADWSYRLHAVYPQVAPGTLSPTIQTIMGTFGFFPTRTLLTTWPIPRLNESYSLANTCSPAIADIAGRGYAQLVDPTIGRTTPGVNEIAAYDPLDVSAPVAVVDLNTGSPSLSSTYPMPSIPAVSDMDGDGLTELVVAYRTAPTIIRVFALDLDSLYDATLTDWSQFQNGPKHTGLYAQPVSGAAALANTVWSERIIVHGNYDVPVSYTLTIKPGTVVEFRPDASLTIHGKIVARGTAAEPIVFDSDSRNTSWDKLIVYSSSTINKLEHVIIRHAEGSPAVFVWEGRLKITHCTIENCANTGVAYSFSTGRMDTTIIRNCGGWGAAIYEGAVTVEGCLIEANAKGGVRLVGGDHELKRDTIRDNGRDGSMGCGILAARAHTETACNEITGNSRAGVLLWSGAFMDMDRGAWNRIENNDRDTSTIQWGQVSLFGGIIAMRSGYNSIAETLCVGEPCHNFIRSCFSSIIASGDMRQNYWNWDMSPAEALDWLPHGIDVDPVMIGYPECGTFPQDSLEITPDAAMFEQGYDQEHQALFTTAMEAYARLVEQYPESPFAEPALDRIVLCEKAVEWSWGDIRDYFLQMAEDSATDSSLVDWCRTTAAWCLVENGDFQGAEEELQDLVDHTDEEQDSIRALITLFLAELKAAQDDSLFFALGKQHTGSADPAAGSGDDDDLITHDISFSECLCLSLSYKLFTSPDSGANVVNRVIYNDPKSVRRR